MKNVIILNMKALFLPDCIMQGEENSEFLISSLNKDSTIVPRFDPIAVREINKMAQETSAEIVISDGWFWTDNFERTKEWCVANGLFINFHENWITPKAMSSYRINEIQWWIQNNREENLLLILDEDYTLKNLVATSNHDAFMRKQYQDKYSKYLGKKRRKALIPMLEYVRHENRLPPFGIEVLRVVQINDKKGFTPEVIKECWGKINTFR